MYALSAVIWNPVNLFRQSFYFVCGNLSLPFLVNFMVGFMVDFSYSKGISTRSRINRKYLNMALSDMVL